jgi:hypothetical protein
MHSHGTYHCTNQATARWIVVPVALLQLTSGLKMSQMHSHDTYHAKLAIIVCWTYGGACSVLLQLIGCFKMS